MKWNKQRIVNALAAVSLVLASTTSIAAEERFSCFERSAKQHLTKISGGSEQPKSLEHYPWMVNLFSKRMGDHFCGGSLINNNLVLTAAHCLLDDYGDPQTSTSDLLVRQADKSGRAAGDSRSVISVATHPDYDPDTSTNDIALIRLDKPFNIANHEIVRLLNPTTAKTWGKANDCAKAIGWGLVDDTLEDAKVIREVNIKITSKSQCSAQWNESRPTRIPDTAICAGYDNIKKDVCRGDSGGPLVVKGGPTGHLLAGLVSFGVLCMHTEHKKTGVYTRISSFDNWIRETAGSM